MVRNALDRIRVGEAGELEIVDPTFSELPLLREIDPEYTIDEAPLPCFRSPRVLQSRRIGVGRPCDELGRTETDDLWQTHKTGVAMLRRGRNSGPLASGEASLLDVKQELAWRLLGACVLCACRCGVDRTAGVVGICRLGTSARVGRNFVHIAEEAPINPSLVLNLIGCGLRCRYCQQHELLDPRRPGGEELCPALWDRLERAGARSLAFVGGNPDESLFAILRFLAAAPEAWELPIVWNNHAYSTPETLALLAGVVDCYIPDFKYGSDKCAEQLSGVRDYASTARATIGTMLAQDVPVIVRHLVLPGHVGCCSLTVLEMLAERACETLLVSVRDQYSPDWKITKRDGELSRRPYDSEIETVRHRARALGLTLIGEERTAR